MSKFYGVIGFAETVETSPGIHTEQITERFYRGDVTRLARRFQSGESINDNIQANNVVSIVADPYANSHFTSIIFITWMGVKWKVDNIEVQYPRLILNLGGVYNENSTGT